jgi:predicted anti-sigma-YlaC factor YlaD
MGTREFTCKELVEVVTDYFEGRMETGDRIRFEQHLVYCGPCRTYVTQMRVTIRATGALREDDVPVEDREHLLEAFREWKQG